MGKSIEISKCIELKIFISDWHEIYFVFYYHKYILGSLTGRSHLLHGPSMFAVKAKIYGVLYKQSSSIAFDETSTYWSALKAPNFSAFHWLPHACLVSIGQHFVTRRVVHLPKRVETSLITESDQSGPNHHLLQLCTARTAWSDLDQAVRAVHSLNSRFRYVTPCSA